MKEFGIRNKLLVVRGYATYGIYLRSQAWKEFKHRYRLSDRPQHCLVCEGKRYQLHHVTYDRVGQELLDDVMPLCRKHHETLHGLLSAGGLRLADSRRLLGKMRTDLAKERRVRAKKRRRNKKAKQKAEQRAAERSARKPGRCEGCGNNAVFGATTCRRCDEINDRLDSELDGILARIV